MDGIDWLSNAEYLVLAPLEGEEPRPLWEVSEDFLNCVVDEPPTPVQVVALLGPALTSLAARGLVEVRRFRAWPASWSQGVSMDTAYLVSESRRIDAWSHSTTRDVLVANITEAGINCL